MLKNTQIKIDVYNWGPCVVRLKIDEDFRKLLLTEAKSNKADFRDKLAGILDHETGYTDESKTKLLPQLSQYLGVYDQAYQTYVSKPYETKPEYVLSSMWINYQKPNDFNPPHDHDGRISFVIYLDIPEMLKEENKSYVGKSCGPVGIQFVYGNGPRDCVTTMSFFPGVGDMFMFPSWLKHWVAPYKSDCTRVSVSGNFHDQVPLNNVVNFAPNYIKNKQRKK